VPKKSVKGYMEGRRPVGRCQRKMVRCGGEGGYDYV
jgi:hypothetical protein